MKKILVIILILGCNVSWAQSMFGLVSGNYAGSNGIYLNPSSIANSKIRWDINLFSANAFVFSNYFYLPKRQAGFFSIVSGDYSFPHYPKPFGVGERNIYVYYKDKTPKNVFSDVKVIGPSSMFRYGDHTFAVHSAARVMSSANNIPYDIANFSFFTMDYSPQHNKNFKRDNYSLTAMSWAELGFSYATMVKRSFYHRWSAGVTVNLLFGNNGSYINGGYTDYIVFNDSIMTVNELNGEIGMALPLDYRTNELELTRNLMKGFGFGIDLGMTYYFAEKGNRRPLKDGAYQKKYEPYTFKLAVAFLDLGFVTFNDQAQKHVLDKASRELINVQQMEWDNLATELKQISELFYNDPDETLVADDFRVYLPTRLTVNADYKLKDCFYLGGIFVAPLRFMNNQIRQPFTLAAIPRYETRYFEVSMPVSLYEWKFPRIGFSVRVHDLTIGTDRLGGFLTSQDFTGMDFYISYKINFNGHTSRWQRVRPCAFQ